jgi:hypothetical protein
MNPSEKTVNSADTADGLDHGLFDLDPRWQAQASVRRAEYLVGKLNRANDELRKIISIMWRGVGTRVSRSKASPFTSESRLP